MCIVEDPACIYHQRPRQHQYKQTQFILLELLLFILVAVSLQTMTSPSEYLLNLMKMSRKERVAAMKYEKNRLWSFEADWPAVGVPAPRDLARAGFFYTGTSDRVQCTFCLGILRSWAEDDLPMREHQYHFSYCQFAKGHATENVPLEEDFYPDAPPSRPKKRDPPSDSASNKLTLSSHGGATAGADYMSSKDTGLGESLVEPDSTVKPTSVRPDTYEGRMLTFNGWAYKEVAPPRMLAVAGFWCGPEGMKGNADLGLMHCFSCHVKINTFVSGMNFEEEHYKLNRSCKFIRELLGIKADEGSLEEKTAQDSEEKSDSGISSPPISPTRSHVDGPSFSTPAARASTLDNVDSVLSPHQVNHSRSLNHKGQSTPQEKQRTFGSKLPQQHQSQMEGKPGSRSNQKSKSGISEPNRKDELQSATFLQSSDYVENCDDNYSPSNSMEAAAAELLPSTSHSSSSDISTSQAGAANHGADEHTPTQKGRMNDRSPAKSAAINSRPQQMNDQQDVGGSMTTAKPQLSHKPTHSSRAPQLHLPCPGNECDRLVQVVSLPCGHFTFCQECSLTNLPCPVCGEETRRYFNICNLIQV